jgi:transcription elongation factor Elf1
VNLHRKPLFDSSVGFPLNFIDCLVCGSSRFALCPERSDRVLIALCGHCGMRVVAEVSAGFSAYGHDYGCGENAAVQFSDYRVGAGDQ